MATISEEYWEMIATNNFRFGGKLWYCVLLSVPLTVTYGVCLKDQHIYFNNNVGYGVETTTPNSYT